LSVSLKSVVGAILAVYFFIAGIVVIKDAACIMGESLTEKIVLIISDTTSGVFAGWIGTAIIQSSGAFDSIIVTFTSSGVMPLTLAVATIIGAEIGTTVTPFLISVLGQARGGKRLNATFTVTMSHVLYNLFTLILFYPAELFFGFFSNIAVMGEGVFIRAPWLSAFPDIIDIATPWVEGLYEFIPPWLGLIIGGVMLVGALMMLEKYMTEVFSVPRSWNLLRATFTKPLRAFFAGFIFTILVPSTSVMVSLLVPLAGSGAILADYYILPYILGANIGTVFDVMIAALATGTPASMGVWLVHLAINLIGTVIFFPLMKPFSILVRRMAEMIAETPQTTAVIAILFVLIPLSVVLLYII
jgi:sodium-dependent phosphate cotransporter